MSVRNNILPLEISTYGTNSTDLSVNLGIKSGSVRVHEGMIRYTHMLQMTRINVDKPSVQISGGYSEQCSADVSRTKSYMARSWGTVDHEYTSASPACIYLVSETVRIAKTALC
ncbi:hypothetical protein CBL_07275 [Carabus blaptoides fortunei]